MPKLFNRRIIILIVISLFLIIGVFLLVLEKNNTLVTKSSSQSAALSSRADWESGTYDTSTDLTSTPGTIKLKNDPAKTDLSSCQLTSSGVDGDLNNVIDGNTSTYVHFNQVASLTISCSANLSVSKIKEYIGEEIQVSYPVQGESIGNCPGSVCWQEKNFIPNIETNYFSLEHLAFMAIGFGQLNEFEAYTTPLTATHTSAFGQIGATGESDRKVIDWENFTATENEPTNSTIRYRFRKTNSDGSWTGDWTDYLDYTGAINLANYSQLAISQDDFTNGKTYLQVETKFTRTDAAANPTVSDYSVSYHTNKRPSTPIPL